jgi:plastocyanin
MMRPLLALIAVAGLAGTGCSKSSNPASPPPAADVTIEVVADNANLSFSPNPGVARVGQTIAWHNGLTVTHAPAADGGAFNAGNIAPGATSAPIMMPTAGSFPYHCTIHPTMVGTLTVNP